MVGKAFAKIHLFGIIRLFSFDLLHVSFLIKMCLKNNEGLTVLQTSLVCVAIKPSLMCKQALFAVQTSLV
jgi:hypothetical protein